MVLTVKAALSLASGQQIDRLDAQLLLAHVLDRPRTWLLAHDDRVLDAVEIDRFRDLLDRRAVSEPLAYLVGEKAFHRLLVQVDRRVLVPRPDTEVLVDWAIEWLAACGRPEPAVVDLGTGSGAIALAIKQAHPSAKLTATDVSSEALSAAMSNARRLDLAMAFLQSDWWSALADHRFDLVVANPPYIAADNPHLAALVHEPMLALSPGGDGTAALQRIVEGAADHLAPNGWLLMEHGFDQAAVVSAMLRSAGFEAITTRPDLDGRPRCSGGRRSAAAV